MNTAIFNALMSIRNSSIDIDPGSYFPTIKDIPFLLDLNHGLKYYLNGYGSFLGSNLSILTKSDGLTPCYIYNDDFSSKSKTTNVPYIQLNNSYIKQINLLKTLSSFTIDLLCWPDKTSNDVELILGLNEDTTGIFYNGIDQVINYYNNGSLIATTSVFFDGWTNISLTIDESTTNVFNVGNNVEGYHWDSMSAGYTIPSISLSSILIGSDRFLSKSKIGQITINK